MELNKSKRGISLIVLVITILVMIILAAAIILSLNSSNISGKASEAKLLSDLANKKEAASVYLAEYEIKVAKGKINSNDVTANDYVREELKKAGIDIADVAVQEDGTILVGIAAQFVNNNVEIGTKVEGYKLNNTTSYTTSGKENTCDSENKTEKEPQPATSTRDENISWWYMGIDKKGNALIVGSVRSSSPKMKLGGKGGYLNGSQELNNACKAMYSSSMGLARSINIDDVTRVLEYTGEKGSYHDPVTVEYVPTSKVKTINEIAKEIGYDMNNFQSQTPEEGKDIGTYKSDRYIINIDEDKTEYNSSKQILQILVFPAEPNDIFTIARWQYWLASSCTKPYFFGNYASFEVCLLSSNQVTSAPMFSSNGTSGFGERALRPVVELNPSVQIAYENGVVTLK